MKLSARYNGLQTLPRHIMAVSLSAVAVHQCADKTRVFDMKSQWELTYIQDKCPPIHQTIKCPKIQELGLCGVSFHVTVIPSSELFGIISFFFFFTLLSHKQLAHQSINMYQFAGQIYNYTGWTPTSKWNAAFLLAACSAVRFSKRVHSETHHQKSPIT